jgi:copper oxidase (laccase) domain-containing protein
MVENQRNVEFFPALAGLQGIVHGFTLRAPGIEVSVDREAALARLDSVHQQVREDLGLSDRVFATAHQVHGKEVAVVDSSTSGSLPEVDGLITADPGVCLGIYAADCCVVYLVDPRRRVVGLLHSGRKGSELGITAVAIARMRTDFGCQPEDLVVQLSPCIRPPQYEIDFAALIVAQARAAGVREVHDCGICTASNPERYYSYRRELGKTGRMLALLAL